MVKMNKNTVLAIIIIGAVIFFMQPQEDKKEAKADVSNAVITRSLSSSSVIVGGTFTVTYTASGFGTGSWGVLFSDIIAGGCTPTSINDGFLGSESTKSTRTFTAPSAEGACGFSGSYQFSDSVEKIISGPGGIVVTKPVSVDCTSLKSSAFSALNAWINSPTSSNRNAALSAINSWAVSC